MIKILHTGDIHIGKKFHFLGSFGREVRSQIKQTFKNIIRLVTQEDIDIVIIAGDLFDDNSPDPPDIHFFLDTLRQTGVPIFLLPGTHDRYNGKTIYRKKSFQENIPRNLYLFNQDEEQTFLLEEFNLAIHGRANLTNQGGEPPLKGIRPHPKARFNIAIAHASINLPHIARDEGHDYFISASQIEESGMDYIALGHWHKFSHFFNHLKTRVYYCGSPEPLQFSGTNYAGTVAIISLDVGNIQVQCRPIGHYIWSEITLDSSEIPTESAFRQKIDEFKGNHYIVKISIKGIHDPDQYFNLDYLKQIYQEHFAFIDFDSRDLIPKWGAIDPGALFPQGTIGSRYIELILEDLKKAKDEDKPLLYEVLRRGMAILLEREGV